MSSLLYKYNPNFKASEGELRKNHTAEFMDSNIFQQQHPQQQQQSSSLTRYRSAPSSFLMEHMDNNGGGGGVEDLRYLQPSSPEVETVLARFISSCNEPDHHDNGVQHHQFEIEERPVNVKEEAGDSVSNHNNGYPNSTHMMYQAPQAQQVHGLDSSSFAAVNSTVMENSMMQSKIGVGNRSNLVRQSSSPAGFFPNLTVDNGFNVMKDSAGYRAGNGVSGEASPSTSRLGNQLNFSSRPSSYSHRMPRIAENENGNSGEGLGDANGSNSHYHSSFPNDSWENSSFNDLKRARDNDGNKFSTSIAFKSQNNDLGNHNHGLTQHLSLPKQFEMPAMEKYLQFEDSIPCKIRAKRGFATHPRSIAERMRRMRISERMKKLQDLFPDMDKQINTAEMLDLAVEFIKDLQKQVKTLKDTKAKCSCSSKQK
ncbi:transcription factor bHLH130-like [Pyrus ussuriensis x Pyrus communis]|uniref:Transcription factor bHLH130-like n=1 Tax=Pyrus ussuriensis x Pyrus communis TaxID=2448454 RepID=A0A5N5EV91_9ROSA|nr:transcription factor bHLH130-like [Pyrus ussuriensis x Pyrus communis]